MPIDKELLDLLVCPLSKKRLILDGETLVSTCAETRRRYPIDDGIPILLIDEAEELDEQNWKSIMAKHGVI